MVPVDHVARIITASVFHSNPNMSVVHVAAHPGSDFVQLLSALPQFGFPVTMTDYDSWCRSLRDEFTHSSNNALYPLQHFVLSDLPHRLEAPILDDRNAMAILLADRDWTQEDLSQGRGVSMSDIGVFLSYLVETGFLKPPEKGAGRILPYIKLKSSALEKWSSAGGRGVRI